MHRRRLAVGIGVAVLVALLAGGVALWYRFFRNDQRPVDVREVEREFRDGEPGTATPGAPAPGVYQYLTEGEEAIDALGGQTNTYPPVTTLTITPTACGADARWDVLTDRSTTHERCLRKDGAWVLRSSTVTDRFFNTARTETFTCSGVVDLPADPQPGRSSTGRCTLGESRSKVVTTVVGRPTLRIAGEPVETVRLRIVTTQGGSRAGGGTEHRWVQPSTNLVVQARVEERVLSPSPVGQVTYTQEYAVTLRSLRPRT